MRILLLQSSAYLPSLGGANKANRLLLEQLAAQGHECHVVGTASGGGATAFRHAGVQVEAVLDGALLRARAAARLRELAPDRVLVSSEDPAQILLEEAVEASPHVVYLAHTTLHLPFGPDGFLQSPGRTELLRHTAGIVAVSGYIRDYIRRWTGLDSILLRFPVYGTGPFPDLGDFDRGFVTLVNPCAVKGISIFLELARLLPEVAFAAVPTWGTTAEDREALAALPNVRILPPAENVDEIFAETRVLLAPSLWGEAFGQVAVEAMLRGIPVLASDVGGLPEAKLGVDYVLPVRPIRRYEERFDERKIPVAVVPEQDLGPWEETLRRLLGDRDLYGRLSRESRRAAHAFVAGLGTGPFLAYLAPASTAPAAAMPPAAVDLQQKLAGMSTEKLELLARRLKKKEGGAPPAPGIPRLPRRGTPGGDRFPLSFAQRRLWFLDRFEPGGLTYNEHFAIRLCGPLAVRLLAAALDQIGRRHEVLRTTYAEGAEEPVQIVHPPPDDRLPLPVADLGSLPDSARRTEAARLATAESRRPFDLAKGPVMRSLLLGLGTGEHLLVITAHHIAVDNWSATVLFAELTALYGALAVETAPVLPELPVQYADFAAWQRSWLTGTTLGEQIVFWRDQLAGAPGVTGLPTDRPRSALQSFRGNRLTALFSPRLAEALRTLARRRDATPYMVLLAACQTLLHRITGQDDLVVGTPVAGRTRREIEPLIGCFLNLLPLRARLGPGLPFEELLDQMRRTALDAFAHQDLPFERLVEALAPERSLSHPPLFQVLFNFLNVPPRTEKLHGGARLTAVPVQTGTTRFDLELYLEEQEQGLVVALVHNTDLFDAVTMVRLIGQLETLLTGVAGRPDRALAELPLLTSAEAHQLVREWNDTAVSDPERAGVHQLFTAQARRTPEAPAAAFQETSITYAELAARASRLARHLRGLGCGPETRVGIALERCLDLPVALLGVLESGAAYVPLDPGYPRERLALVLEDAAPRVLITEERLLSALPPAPGVVLCLSQELTPSGPDTPVPFHDLQLAYTLYTSGSTGRPKGVEVPHRTLANFLRSMRRAPGFAPGERLLAVTSLAFDIAALEIFLPLTTGGCVELASREEATDGALLAARLRASEASVLQATPATWRMLLESGWTGDPGLKALCGGEALPRDLAAALTGRTRELWNLYGPTETTVWSAAARVLPGETGPVSIGPPIAETQIHLLDRDLQTVPLGVPGELCIGGAGLARGYLGRPDLTAERFVPDPLAAEMGTPGARLYRTGDLARHLPGGRMEVLGRIDHQVKLRGFRIELGEIEAALSHHPGIREAVVTLRDGALVAYLVPAGETASASAELREFLRASLPEPMIPAAFVELAALPLTPNRKVDRRALPAPGPAETTTARFVAPRTPAEEVLAGLWSEVLGRERVGLHDSFFDLGGHSLLATRVVSRLRSVFGVELPLRALFERPTVAEMAPLVEEVRRSGRSPAAPPLVPVPRKGDLPLSFTQERLWFLDQLTPGSAEFNIAAAVRLEGALDSRALEAALGEIERRHEILRTTFPTRAALPVQVVAPATVLRLPWVDLSGLPEARRVTECGLLVREETRLPFDLARGPVWRTTLVRLDAADHALFLTLHHIVGDAWSLGILVRELGVLYAAFSQGLPTPLPELPVQFADFVVWQRRRLDGEGLAPQLAYWRERLTGAAALVLPTDLPCRPEQPIQPACLPVVVDTELTLGLAALARTASATLFMAVLAAFQAVLALHTGRYDLVAGSNVANRNRLETEGLIGCFINVLVLRTDLSGDPTFEELLHRMREVVLGASAHQDLPFDRLVQELEPSRTAGRTPLFQVKVDLLPAAPPAELSALRLRLLDTGRIVARYDLHLSLQEEDGALRGELIYDAGRFAATTVGRLGARFGRLLAEAVCTPGARLSELAQRLDTAEAAEQRVRRQELGRANLTSLRRIQRRPLPGAAANLSEETET